MLASLAAGLSQGISAPNASNVVHAKATHSDPLEKGLNEAITKSNRPILCNFFIPAF